MTFGGPIRIYGPAGEIGPSRARLLSTSRRWVSSLTRSVPSSDGSWKQTSSGPIGATASIRSASIPITPPSTAAPSRRTGTDSFSYRFGTQYDLNEHWALRGGYAYGTSAVPQSTFSPLVPDAAYHLFSLGLGYTQDNWSVDAAWQYIYRETRHISNSVNSPLVDGTWENQMYGFMISFTAKL